MPLVSFAAICVFEPVIPFLKFGYEIGCFVDVFDNQLTSPFDVPFQRCLEYGSVVLFPLFIFRAPTQAIKRLFEFLPRPFIPLGPTLRARRNLYNQID